MQIRFEDLLVGEVEHECIGKVKKLALKAYKKWKKQRLESGLKKICCGHDEIDLMLYFGSIAISRIRSILSRDGHTSSIDNHIKQDLDQQLEENFNQFRQELKKVYDQWGQEENNPEKTEILYRTMIFKID